MTPNKSNLSQEIANFIDTFWTNTKSRTITESEPFKTDKSINFIDLPEAIIRYKLVGKGKQVIVLAVDPPVVIEQYETLLKYLVDDFRVIVFELPGFGFSLPRSTINFGFTETNNLIAKFLKKLDLAPYLLAFPCGSAYGAIDIANRFPELVKGFAMIQAPSWEEEIKWKHGRDKKGILAKPIIGQLLLQILKRKRAPQWFEAAVGDQNLLSDFIKTTDKAFAQGACFCLASAFQQYLTDSPPDLSEIKQPSIIFWGDADKSHKRTDKSSSSTFCPNADIFHFPNAGHFPELEEPQEFAKRIKEWVLAIETNA